MRKAKIVRAAPDDKLQVALEKARNSPEYEKEGLRIEIEELHWRIDILEKRWKVLRKELRKLDEDTLITTAYFIKTLMTEITRKIK